MANKELAVKELGPGPSQIYLNSPLKVLKIPRPQYVLCETSIRDTVVLMKSFKIGSILVVDEKVQLMGIATERDFLMKVIGMDVDLDQPIESVMTPNPRCLTLDDSLSTAITYMHVGKYRHIPIVAAEDSHSPIGIISIKDVMGHIYESM